MVQADSTTCELILNDLIRIGCYTKNNVLRKNFNRQGVQDNIWRNVQVLAKVIPEFDIGSDLYELTNQLKNVVGVKTFQFLMTTALKLVAEKSDFIDKLLVENVQLSAQVARLSEQLKALTGVNIQDDLVTYGAFLVACTVLLYSPVCGIVCAAQNPAGSTPCLAEPHH
jgi:hypothetical protein